MRTTIIDNPAGTYSVVGSTPESCLNVSSPPTRSQVLGQRTFQRDGITYGWDGRAFDTLQEARDVLDAAGVDYDESIRS